MAVSAAVCPAAAATCPTHSALTSAPLNACSSQDGRLDQAGGGPAGAGGQEGIQWLEDPATGSTVTPLPGQPDGPEYRAQGIGLGAVGHGGRLLAARTGRGLGLILLPALLEGERHQLAAPVLNPGFQLVAVNGLVGYDQGGRRRSSAGWTSLLGFDSSQG